jgi:hypothetical protein
MSALKFIFICVVLVIVLGLGYVAFTEPAITQTPAQKELSTDHLKS